MCLASTSTQKGDLSALASPTDTSGALTRYPSFPTEDPRTCEKGALLWDQEHFTQAWTSCLEPSECSVGKEPVGELSLSPARRRVPKPTRIYSSREGKNWQGPATSAPNKDSAFLPPPATGIVFRQERNASHVNYKVFFSHHLRVKHRDSSQ